MKGKPHFKTFSKAWWFLQDHPLLEKYGKFSKCVEECLYIMVQSDQEVWLEFGFPTYDRKLKQYCLTHDLDFDVKAPTFEKAIVKLANLVLKKYG